jgi:hypothetical protein
MALTLSVQDALLPVSDLDVRTIAGHVHRRTDKRTTAEAPPPSKSKSKSGVGLNKAEGKKLDTGDNGESDSDEEDKKRRVPDDAGDSPSESKPSRLRHSRLGDFLADAPYYRRRETVASSRTSLAQKIRDFDLAFEQANAPRGATR